MNINEDLQPINILLVEDNPGDIRLTQEALKDSKITNNIFITKNGEEALDFLYKVKDFIDAPTPDIIMLDLNLPKMNGHEVLQKIKNEDALKKIPVIVLTTSRSEQDIKNSYDLHANCFITKPSDFDKFVDIIKLIESFWVKVARIPS